jgi:PAS domain S-box-containing protein
MTPDVAAPVDAAVRDLFEAAPVGVGLFDCGLRYVMINEALAAINGLSVDRHLGRRVGEVVPDLREQVEPVLNEVLTTGRPALDVVVAGRTSAHRTEAREWLANFYRVGPADDPTGVGVVVADVTDRRRAERRLRQLIDGLFTFVGLCDPDGVLTEANRTALDAAGLEPVDVIGRPFWEAYWWSHDPEVQRQLRDAIAAAREGLASRYDVDVRVKGGELLTIDFQLVPIIEDGRVAALVPSGMDIGDRRRNERQMEATATLARELSAARTTGDVIDAVLRSGSRALDTDFTNVALVDGSRVQVFQPPLRHDDLAVPYQTLPLTTPVPICDAIRTGTEVVVPHPSGHGGRYREFFEGVAAAGYGTTSAVPLVSGGRVIGALGAAWRPDRPVGSLDASRMAVVAKLCAQTLGRTIRADRQEEFITTLQRQLLPTVPEVRGLEIAVSYQPATDGIGFGGDWYDIVALDEHRTAFIVGDIAGHGIEAAAEMTVVRSALNSLIRLDTPLDDVLPRAQAASSTGEGGFIGTVAIVIVDTAADTFEFVTAGHPAPLLRTADGGAHFAVHLGNPPLGIATGPSHVGREPFVAGSTMVLFTDGLVERRRELVDVGLERLRSTLVGCGADASATLSEVTDRLRPPEGSWGDDVALVVIRHAPPARVASSEGLSRVGGDGCVPPD